MVFLEGMNERLCTLGHAEEEQPELPSAGKGPEKPGNGLMQRGAGAKAAAASAGAAGAQAFKPSLFFLLGA